ncbi:serine protease [Streptomyces sp. ISL-94]|uniref:trypsin-like serine peptidase n=1 Tax=Streptomyces sp. ISL-94 TaxID=2819190 RepID=UPI001BE5596F|nr:trypsin-like peptidase domain-containing protein [Streptomyces sp. ISL-94]MBT2477980.1 trypsin-like peptidase domain-containing protein [Streptomyces sp. ISL-94]
MIHRTHPRRGGRSGARARRASQILPALGAMAALVSVDLPDAVAGPPLGVTAQALSDAEADRVGALFAGGLDGGHFCTASVVRSDGRDVIATAAHCLDPAVTTVFAPGYRDGKAPYGVWKLTSVYVAPGWRNGADPDADIAFATVAPVDGGQTAAVEDLVGGFPVAAEQPSDATVTVIGYPRSLEAPLRCANTTALLSETQRRIGCPDLSGGTSGSPWLVDGALAGVLGGYEGGGTVPEVSYSAVMGDQAVELYREASVTS